MKIELVKYNYVVTTEYESGNKEVVKYCNSITFTNTGDEIVRVNDMILYPGVIGVSLGDSRSIGGNFGEEYCGNIRVQFAGGGANPALEIIQKFYNEFGNG